MTDFRGLVTDASPIPESGTGREARPVPRKPG
jgi:hypothetical protein